MADSQETNFKLGLTQAIGAGQQIGLNAGLSALSDIFESLLHKIGTDPEWTDDKIIGYGVAVKHLSMLIANTDWEARALAAELKILAASDDTH